MRTLLAVVTIATVVVAQDPPELVAKARAIHERVLTLDTHKDIAPLLAKVPPAEPEARARFRRRYDPSFRGSAQVDFPKMREGGLNCAFFIVYVGQGPLTKIGFKRAKDAALAKFMAIHRMARRFPDDIVLATSPGDVVRGWKSGKLVACIGIENGYPMGEDLDLIDLYAGLGARYMSLTHNRHSQLGDSHTPKEPLHGGISELGEKAVARMNELGIMVDVSHASKQTMLDAVACSKAPVIASHSACAGLYAHGRNLDDEQLDALKENGGVIQIVAFASYVKDYTKRQEAVRALRKELGLPRFAGSRRRPASAGDAERTEDFEAKLAEFRKRMKEIDAKLPPSTVSDVVDHVDYAVKRIGIDHVAISSDFDGGGGVGGWNDASETFNVTLELVRRGYTEAQIAKIWSGNTLRVWREVAKVARDWR